MAGNSDIKEAVRTHYAAAARQLEVVTTTKAGACCSDEECSCGGDYVAGELGAVGMSEDSSLGCGNPTAIAELQPGEVVLDLGSGAGLDVLLSARKVGPSGHAYGLDMTGEMLTLAEANRRKVGVENATFLEGSIEKVPLPDASVDVVISNCVINLATDKNAVLTEAFRVLKPGGRLAVADMVEIEPLSEKTKKDLEAWACCIGGALPLDGYRSALTAAGFRDVAIEVHATQAPADGGKVGSAYVRARKP